jgi:hypothetical protein
MNRLPRHTISGKPGSLLANDDKIAKIFELLGPNFTHRGEIFEPTDTFYADVSTSDGVRRMAVKLCAWLGVRPSRLTVTYVPRLPEPCIYRHTQDSFTITIDERYTTRPFECAALLTQALMHYYLGFKRQFYLADELQNEEFAGTAAIYCGFGIIMLNGVAAGRRYENLPLMSRKVRDTRASAYISSFSEYIDHFHISPRIILRYALPRARKYLPKTVNAGAPKIADKAPYVRAAELTRRKNLRFLSCVVGALFVLGIPTIIFTSRQPKIASPEVRRQRDKVTSLRTLFEQCTDQLTERRGAIDHPDIFTESSINAEANECISISNRYNHELREYNRLLAELKK